MGGAENQPMSFWKMLIKYNQPMSFWKMLIEYNLLHNDLLPSLDKDDLVPETSTEFHSYCSWTWGKWQGKDINITWGWEGAVFQVRQKQWVFWTPHTSVKSNFLSQILHWSKNALGNQSLGCQVASINCMGDECFLCLCCLQIYPSVCSRSEL